MPPTKEASTQTNSSPPNKQASKPSLIYVIGVGGASKGTLGALLAKKLTKTHQLSVGDYLRSLLESNAQQTFGGLEKPRKCVNFSSFARSCRPLLSFPSSTML